MITYLVEKNGKWLCGNCRIEQKELREQCPFCNYSFSNFEIALEKNFNIHKQFDLSQNEEEK